VFFLIVTSALQIGSAVPNLQNIGAARAAAYLIWQIIDRVTAVLLHFFDFAFR